MDNQLNLLEFFVHHEDVRRAQPDWAPRQLDPAEQSDLWNRPGDRLAVMMRTAPVGVLLQRSDTGDVAGGRAGPPTVALVGPPAELVLYVYGRQRVARVEAYGEPEAVGQLTTRRWKSDYRYTRDHVTVLV